MALTQHLMRRSHGLRPAATDTISLTIGKFYDDAPLNHARKLDRNVYPSAADRDDILQTELFYFYHPSARQNLQNPLALTPLSPSHNHVLIDNHYLT